MTNTIRTRLATLAISLTLSACTSGGGSHPPRASLENTTWILAGLTGQVTMAPPRGKPAGFTLVAKEHRVQGGTGCNRLIGDYQLDGEKLVFDGMASTRMACPESGDQEARFLEALDATRGWRLRGDTLELLDAEGNTRAQLKALPTE